MSAKHTSSDWPDPTDWVNRLCQAMTANSEIYEAEPDPLLKRNKANVILGIVLSSLLELPAFRNGGAHLPLKDLMIFLQDLDRGRDHPWAKPFNFGGTNATTTAQSELKLWVRAAYAVLTENGFKAVEAYRHIANGLTKSGRTSRGGEPLRWQLVGKWCREEESVSGRHIREKVQAWWTAFHSDWAHIRIVDRANMPVGNRQLVAHFVDLFWSLPHLRDRSVSW